MEPSADNPPATNQLPITKFPLTQEELRQFSLTDFLNSYERILAVLGVVATLAVLSQNLPSSFFSYGISFAFLFATGIVFTELRSRFPPPLHLAFGTQFSLRLAFHFYHLWNRLGLFAIFLDLGLLLFIAYTVQYFPTLILVVSSIVLIVLIFRFFPLMMLLLVSPLARYNLPVIARIAVVIPLIPVVFVVMIGSPLFVGAVIIEYFDDPRSPSSLSILRAIGVVVSEYPRATLVMSVVLSILLMLLTTGWTFFPKFTSRQLSTMRRAIRRIEFERDRPDASEK